MAWVTLDVGFLEHPKIAELPSETARVGWIATILAAKRQKVQGRFVSEKHYRSVLGRYSKYLATYESACLLDRLDDGSLEIHGWAEYQRDPAGRKAVERADLSSLSHTDVTTESQESPPSRARPALSRVLVNVSNDKEQRNDGFVQGSDDDPLLPVERWLARKGAAPSPGSKTETDLARLVDQHGASRVIAAFGRLPQPLHDAAQYVYGAKKALNPIPDAKGVAAAEREAQEKASLDRRVEATKRRIAAFTGGQP